MKLLREQIRKEIKRISEELGMKKYPLPVEIRSTLINNLKMRPLIRYVKNVKAANTIPPSYRIFLHNEEFFDIIYRDFSLMAKIGSKEYYLDQKDETNLAIKHINRLMTEPIMKKQGEEEEETTPTPSPAKAPSPPPPPPPPPPTPEPEDEE